MGAPRRGFSLIELVVVMSIIAVLAGILLPAVRMVRELAGTATCASNMREIGTFLIAYTGENDGLFPGGGHVGTGSQSWCDILNRELLGDERITLQKQSNYGGTRGFACPRFDAPADTFFRCYQMNAYAGGGAGQQYGKVIAPPALRGPEYAGWDYYYFGAALARFAAQSEKVLLQESMRASDNCAASWPDGSMVLLDAGTYRSMNGGSMAFRHAGGSLANFLCMDGHIEALHPSGSLNMDARYRFAP